MSEQTRDLKLGAFYWVVVVPDPEFDDWWNKPMPARYAGGERWDFLGDDGPSKWPVQWVGPEIVPPIEFDGGGRI